MTTEVKQQPAEPQPLTAAQRRNFDGFCAALHAAQKDYDFAAARLRDTKYILVGVIEKDGYVPANAEQSRRLEGERYVATLTRGRSITLDGAQITKLELALSGVGKPKLFRSLFERRVEYSMKPGAEDVLPAAKIPAAIKTRLTAIYARCFSVGSKAPSVKVETLAEVAERTAKAAKKSAKKAGK